MIDFTKYDEDEAAQLRLCLKSFGYIVNKEHRIKGHARNPNMSDAWSFYDDYKTGMPVLAGYISWSPSQKEWTLTYDGSFMNESDMQALLVKCRMIITNIKLASMD